MGRLIGCSQSNFDAASPPLWSGSARPAVCACGGNHYNCADFQFHAAAQACYLYCLSVVGYDVHRLDADSDGVACETLH